MEGAVEKKMKKIRLLDVEKIELDGGELVTRSPSTKATFSLLHAFKVPADFLTELQKSSDLDSFLEDRLKLSPKLLKEVTLGLRDQITPKFEDYCLKDGLMVFCWATIASAKEIGMRGHVIDKVKEALKGLKEEEKKGFKEEEKAWKLSKVEKDLHTAVVNVLVILHKCLYF